MAIPTSVATLAMSLVSGAIRLGKRLDEVMAEETAIRAELGLSFPVVTDVPTVAERKAALRRLLRESEELQPDPLGDDRARIKALLRQSNVGAKLWKFCLKYGLSEFDLENFDLDQRVQDAMRKRSKALDIDAGEVQTLAYFLAAGSSRRSTSLGFQIAATVVDVLAEVASENARFLVKNPKTRSILVTILDRFAKPELAEMDGWGQLLGQTLSATVNGLIDSRDILGRQSDWLRHSLSALATARDSAPNGEGFVLGLMRGEGFQSLVYGILDEGAAALSGSDASALEEIMAAMLTEAAAKARDADGFELYFQDNWHLIVRAGLQALEEQGPRLLSGTDPLLSRSLIAAVSALADGFSAGPPSGDTLLRTLEAAIGTIASDPSLLGSSIDSEWLRDLISSLAELVHDSGLRQAFSQAALESYLRTGLQSLSRHPEMIAGDNQLVANLIRDVLASLAEIEGFDITAIANTAVSSALASIAENRDLLGTQFAGTIGELAAHLAELVQQNSLTRIEAKDLLHLAAQAIATNAQLFEMAEGAIASLLVDAIVDVVADDDAGLLGGALLVDTIQRVLGVFAARGLTLFESEDATLIIERFQEIVRKGLDRAAVELGRRIDRSKVPLLLGALADAWARSEPRVQDPTSPDFADFVTALAESITQAAAAASTEELP